MLGPAIESLSGLWAKITTLAGTSIGEAGLGASLGAALLGAIGGGITGKLIDNHIIGPLIDKLGGDHGLAEAFRNFKWFGDGGAFDTIGQAFSDYFSTYKFGDITGYWLDQLGIKKFFGETVPGAWGDFTGWVSNSWNHFTGWVSDGWNTVSGGLSTTWDNIKSTASGAWENVKTTIS